MNWNPFRKPSEEEVRARAKAEVEQMLAELDAYPKELFISCVICDKAKFVKAEDEAQEHKFRDIAHICWVCSSRAAGIEKLFKKWVNEVLDEREKS